MERRKMGIIFMAIMSIGAIISAVGMMVVSGLDLGEPMYNALQTTSLFATLFIMMGLVFFFDDEQDQSENESDSSLL